MIRKAAVHCDHKRHTNKDTPEDMEADVEVVQKLKGALEAFSG